jgi:hypothetical protein
MHIKTIALSFLLTVLGAPVGTAQTPAPTETGQTFDFTNKPTPQGLQEIANILRTVGDMQHVTVDSAAVTVSVQGTPDQISMCAWLVHNLNQPANTQLAAAPPQQFLVAGKSDDVIRIFRLVNVAPLSPQALQEVLTVLRTVTGVQRVFNYSALADLVVRGPATQVAVADQLIKSLDVAPGLPERQR